MVASQPQRVTVLPLSPPRTPSHLTGVKGNGSFPRTGAGAGIRLPLGQEQACLLQVLWLMEGCEVTPQAGGRWDHAGPSRSLAFLWPGQWSSLSPGCPREQCAVQPPHSHSPRATLPAAWGSPSPAATRLYQPPLCCRKANGDGSGTKLTAEGISGVRGPNTSGRRQLVVILGEEVTQYWTNPGHDSWPA